MSEKLVKTDTIKYEDEDSWGKLTPLSAGLSTFSLKDDLILIGRNPACSIQINDKRLSGKHCQIKKQESKIVLTDLSTNGTYVKDNKVGKGKEIQIQHDFQIWLLPASKVNPTQALGFKLELPQPKEEEPPKKQEQKKQTEKQKQKQKIDTFAQSIKDQITCSFCFEIMHGPVSIQPCNHRFCGGCLTQLVNSKKGNCIQCRKEITTAVKDSSFNSIIDDYLKSHPEEKRDEKQIQEMDKKNIFGFDPVDVYAIINGKPMKKKAEKVAPTSSRGRRGRRALTRVTSDLSASDDDEPRCRECAVTRNGFRCTSSQVHVNCITCGKLMAQRSDSSLHQNCILCTNYFCNLYFPPCSKTGIKLKLVSNRRDECKIDADLLRSNRVQFEALRNYLIGKKMTSKEVFDDVVRQMGRNNFSYIIDRKIMKIAPIGSREIKIQADSAVCDTCWKDLWFQMVFFYFKKIQSSLPSSIRDRPTCYWGINCRTMDHNADHAKRYNHMVYQTRF